MFLYCFLSSVIILITIALNSLSGKLLICISLSFFFCGFISFSHLEHIPLSSHFVWLSLLVYEIRWNSYLSWFWRCVLVGEHPFAVCVCSVALVGDLDLKWARVMTSPGLSWQPPPWWGLGLETEWLESEPGVKHGFSCGMMAVAALVGVWLEPEGLELQPGASCS